MNARYLQLCAAAAFASVLFTTTAFAHGGSYPPGATPAPATMRPTRQQLASEVTPVLLEALAHENNPDILNAAMIASAAIGEKPELVLEALKKLLTNGNASVSENAALSIGILAFGD